MTTTVTVHLDNGVINFRNSTFCFTRPGWVDIYNSEGELIGRFNKEKIIGVYDVKN